MQENFVGQLRAIVGANAVLTERNDLETHVTDWRGAFHGNALAVVFPNDTNEAASIVKLCAATKTPIVPQGGNTGLAAGATPLDLPNAIVLNLSRMRAVRSLDTAGSAITVEAGCVVASVQEAAERANRYFPLSFGAEGSAQIGGAISTNAGGSAVLRYGSMRSLVLGLEIVLPSGATVDGLRTLRKDNAGYDWKHWFIGAEGTLGIITAATLRLFPRPRTTATAVLSVESPARALELFVRMQGEIGDTITACELFPDASVALRIEQTGTRFPLERAPWYVLLEASSSIPNLREHFEETLALAIGDDAATGATIAENAMQTAALWEWRESIPETEKRTGRSAKHDVSVPITDIPAFIETATNAVETTYPGARVIAFGHIGDGNVHFNVLLPLQSASDSAATEELTHAINTTVHRIVATFRGSITAEHGIGRYRRQELREYRAPTELALMRELKHALDPENIMNPGAIF